MLILLKVNPPLFLAGVQGNIISDLYEVRHTHMHFFSSQRSFRREHSPGILI